MRSRIRLYAWKSVAVRRRYAYVWGGKGTWGGDGGDDVSDVTDDSYTRSTNAVYTRCTRAAALPIHDAKSIETMTQNGIS